MRFNVILPWLFMLSVLWTASPPAYGAETAQSQFATGVGAFQKGDLKLARLAFQDSLKLDPDNPVVLHNLAMTEEKAGNIGLALGLWRKALAVDPRYHPAEKAITWARGRLERPEIPHEVEYWETFRNIVLNSVSLSIFLGFTAAFLLAGGWLFLRYFGARRRAILDERPLPPLPTVAIVFLVGFVAFALLSAAKAWDTTIIRGTILPKKIEARSTPDKTSTALFDLYEGLEVILRQSNGDWTQVTYPGGPTGWIPSSAVFPTTSEVKTAGATP